MSREVDLYKDKIEVSLDGRQIFYLFFGGAVIVGLVFVLGVMVGRRVEARGHVDRANVTTTADPLAALDRLESGNRLSFQDALRGNETRVEASDVEKKIDAMQKMPAPLAKPEAKKPEAKKEDVKKEEPAKAPAPAPEPKKEEKKVEAKVEKKDEPKKDELKKDEPKKEEKPEQAKAEPKKEPKFTLQLSSFQDKNEAQTYLDSVKASGYQAYVTEGDVDGKQFFRVRMGSYKSLEAANEAKSEFEKSAKKSAIVTKL
ncbi:MAG TPA: SPOR domain-containing protein [Kofleriaceae bacterium]|nr:SPOR domain-containing protein [Kofleriaceae bacterium]